MIHHKITVSFHLTVKIHQIIASHDTKDYLKLCLLAYADDTAIFAKTAHGLTNALNVIQKNGNLIYTLFIPQKSFYL